MNPPLENTRISAPGLLRPGTEVLDGRFRVIELLGQGGMGDVYLAEQVSLGRKVALKTLRKELNAQPGMAERFKREALLLSQVDHPSVVRIIDFGQADDSYVLVMEYIEGENLAVAARHGPFNTERALRVLSDIAEGLEAIHARGIIHRDLKLENVLLSPSPQGERARLLDFGIARFAEVEGEGGSVTQAGVVLGTPEYIAPEQATAGKVDARSDVYAFGVLAYRLLSGQHPFRGPTPREYLVQHITTEPSPLTQLVPEVSEPLAKLTMACLSKSPEARPQGGQQLRNALGASFSLTPSSLPTERENPVPLTARAQKLGKQWKERAGELTRFSKWLFALVGVAAAGLAFRWWPEAQDPTAVKAYVLLDQGKASAAMELLDAAPNKDHDGLRLARAEALHQQKRHSEEWSALLATAPASLSKMRPALLAAILTDYPTSETDEDLLAVLRKLPDEKRDLVRKWAKAPYSAAQWGALRWADAQRLPDTDLVSGYINALESNDCDINQVSAERLGDLRDVRAVDALTKLVGSPRKPAVLFFARSCGHQEAKEALLRLGVSPTPEER